MLSDDVFRTRLQSTCADLARWADTVRGSAEVTISEGPTYWKLAAAPHAAGACPFEMVLRGDQLLDITIAGETYEDRAMPPLSSLLPLVEALARGDVVERHWTSQETGALVMVETMVGQAGGEAWTDRRIAIPELAGAATARLETRDRHFLSYRRLSRT